MKKESVKKFDLEAAFKALDEIEIPQTKGIKANRVDLKERFGHKPATETLVEDYYDVSSTEDLKDAKEERDGEIAKAKLARIEKIVDLNAESPEDLLPSYVGKVIMQCPQCMTLFYKNPEDIEPSEENPDIVNLNEPCQHCGNTSGYTLIGKVGAVSEDEADKYDETSAEENENELNLDFGKGTEEVDAEGTGEGAKEMSDEETKEDSSDEASSDEDLDLDLNLDEVPEEEPEEEKKEESLNLSKEASENESDHKSENLTLNEEVEDTKVEVEANNIEKQLTETSVRAMRDTWTIEESSILKYYPNKHQVEDYINKAKAVELAEAAKGNTVRVIIYEKFNRIPNDGPYFQKMGHPVKICYDSIENPEVVKIFVQNNLMLEEGLDEAKSISGRVNYNAEGEDFAEGYILKVERNSIDYRPRFTYSINTYKKEIERLNNYFKSHFDRSRGKTLTAIENENLTENKLAEGIYDVSDAEFRAMLKDKTFQEFGEALTEEKVEESKVSTAAVEKAISEINAIGAEDVEEEKKEESLNLSKETSEDESEHKSENLTLNEEVDKDLDEKLKAHNDYIAYLQQMIKQEEEALKKAENDEIKAAIQRRLDAFNADLEAALPDAVKAEVSVEEEKVEEPVGEEAKTEEEKFEEPKEETAEEKAEEEAPVDEALTEETKECKVVLSDKPEKEVFAGTKEECEKIIEKNKETKTAKEHGLKIVEPATDENKAEEKSEKSALKESVESEIDSIIASWGVNESLTEEGDLDKLLDSDEFKTPVSEEEIDAARREVAKESLEEKCGKQKITEESDSEIAAIINSWEDAPEVPVEESCEGKECESKEKRDDCLKEELDINTYRVVLADYDSDDFDINVEFGLQDEEENDVADQEWLLKPGQTKGDLVVYLSYECAYTSIYVHDERPATADEIKTISGFDTVPGITDWENYGSIDESLKEAKKDEEEPTDPDQAKLDANTMLNNLVADEDEADDKDESDDEEDESDDEESEEEETEEPEFNEDDIDELDECSLNKHIDEYLKEVYSNVKSYETTDCELKEGKLIVEGKISFNSGKEKLTMFEFLPAYCEGKLFFEGYNKDFSEDKAFKLNCSINESKTLITESFGYKYKINENLVEGLK